MHLLAALSKTASVPEIFLKGVNLICNNALWYNPDYASGGEDVFYP